MENLALRYQLLVLSRTVPERPRLNAPDRLFWVSISFVLGQHFRVMRRVAVVARDRPAGDSRRLAQEAVSGVLDMEDLPRPGWPGPECRRVEVENAPPPVLLARTGGSRAQGERQLLKMSTSPE
jgi:hypothetical protein